MRLRQSKVFLTVAMTVLAATCSSPNKPDPVVELAIHSVAPNAGPATGGTEVTIRGAGFAAGATIMIGGRAATEVNVRGTDMLTAKTPVSPTAGSVDIVVTLNGRSQVLAGGFRYEPIAPNTAPVIRSIAAQGRRPRQPATFADYGETIQVTLIVEDAESAPAQLAYRWQQSCGGTFIGSGPLVEWNAPAAGTLPSICTLEVTVTDGPHVVGRSIAVRLHNSAEEVGALALEFLTEFADNLIPAATTVQNFSNSCAGKADELRDVTEVRRDYTINTFKYEPATVRVAFGGMCKTKVADACVITPVQWTSTYKPTGRLDTVIGISTISGVYRDSRWWLCDSLFDGPNTLGFWPLR